MGLIDAQTPPNAQPQSAPQPERQLPGGGSPDEQKWYERVVIAAVSVIYKDGPDKLQQTLAQHARNPAEALAGAASGIVIQLDHKLGDKIPEGVILPAAGEILGLVAEFADAKKIFTADQPVIERAMTAMVQQLMVNYGVQPEHMKDFMDKIGQDQAQGIAEHLKAISASTAAGSPPGSPGTKLPQPAAQPPQQPQAPQPQGVA